MRTTCVVGIKTESLGALNLVLFNAGASQAITRKVWAYLPRDDELDSGTKDKRKTIR